MAADARNVSVGFTGDISGLQRSCEGATAALRIFGDNARATGDRLASDSEKSWGDYAKSAGKAIGAVTLGLGTLAVAGVAAIEKVGQQAVNLVEPIRRAAGAFDQTIESMSSVGAVASAAGTGVAQLGGSFQNLQTKAREGDAATVKALGAIGVSAREAATLSQDALAVRMANAFSTAKDSANKAQAGVILFGSEAAKLVPVLDRGGGAVQGMMDALDRAGAKMGGNIKDKIQGTNSLFAVFGDRMRELRETVDGQLLQSFVAMKPAIDGLSKLFADVVGNVTALIEHFSDLTGAGRKSSESTGLMADATRIFAEAIVKATAAVQEWAVQSVQKLSEIGVSFSGLSKVATAFGSDITNMTATASAALYAAFQAAIEGVVRLFNDLAAAGKAAMSFDLSGVRKAFSDIGTHAKEGWDKVKGSVSIAAILPETTKAYDTMQAGAAAYAKSLDPIIDKIRKQREEQLALIAAGGAKGGPVKQDRNVSDPNYTAPGKADQDAIRAAQAAVDGRIRVLHRELQEKQAIYNADVVMFGASEDSKFARMQADEGRAYEEEKRLLQQRAAIVGQSEKQREDSLNKIAELESRHRTQMINLDVQSFQSMKQRWSEGIGTITNAFNGQIRGMLAGTTSFAQAFKNVIGDVVSTFISAVIRMGTEWLAGEATRLTASLSGNAARAAAEQAANATSLATMAAKALSAIGASVGQVFAGVSAFLSPVLGPAAPAAAGAVAAGVGAVAEGMVTREVGAWSVPKIEPTLLHPGEMVFTAAQSKGLRKTIEMAQGAMSGDGSGGTSIGDIHIHAPNVFDSAGLMRMLTSGGVKEKLARSVFQTIAKTPSIRSGEKGGTW